MSEIKTAVQKLAGTYGMTVVELLTCTVTSADEASRTCIVTPVNSNLAAFPAMLMPDIDDGVLMIPSAGSTVHVIYSPQNAPLVVQYTQVDKILFITGDTEISMTNGTVQVSQADAVLTLTGSKLNFKNNSQNLTTVLQNILSHVAALTVSTGTGPSSVPINLSDFQTDLSDLNQLLN